MCNGVWLFWGQDAPNTDCCHCYIMCTYFTCFGCLHKLWIAWPSAWGQGNCTTQGNVAWFILQHKPICILAPTIKWKDFSKFKDSQLVSFPDPRYRTRPRVYHTEGLRTRDFCIHPRPLIFSVGWAHSTHTYQKKSLYPNVAQRCEHIRTLFMLK